MARARHGARAAWILSAGLATACAEGFTDAAGLVELDATDGATDGDSDGEPPTDEDTSHADDGASSDDGDGFDDTAAPDPDPTTSAGATARVLVHPGATKDAELVPTLSVGRSESGANRRVVLRLDPQQIPDLLEGDRLITPAEVQVTTRCDIGQTAAGCDYDPKIRAQLILTGDPNDKSAGGSESRALSDPQTQTCTKNEHHCMFVFRPSHATNTITGGLALPCVAAGTCHVNLVMWAWHSNARADGKDKVIVGGNEGNYLDNGVVEGDKARLMVVRERGLSASDRHERETTGSGSRTVPTNASPVLVYSHKLRGGDGDVSRHDQFVVEAKVVANVNSRARFSTLMFLTKDPNATEGNGLDKIAPQQIGEHNGINCTPGQSPCKIRKVAVFRATDDITGPVYLNVVVKSAVPGGGAANVTVDRSAGWVRSTRYDPAHKG